MKEGQHTEWKETWRDEFLRWICGFANAAGGSLHIGRNDRGTVVGVPNAGRLLEEIPNKVRDLLGILVAVNRQEEDGREWLEIVGEPHPYPVSYKGKHPSQPFNPNVANVFFRAGMIEAWGRGIERILEACRAAQAPAPRIRYEPSGLWVEFPFPMVEISGVGEKLGEKLGGNRAAILRAIAANPKVTVVRLADQLGLSTTAVENNLRYLKAQKLILRIGPAKGGFWQVNETKP